MESINRVCGVASQEDQRILGRERLWGNGGVGPDRINNVERLVVRSPAVGFRYVLSVAAQRVTTVSQPFSLVLTGHFESVVICEGATLTSGPEGPLSAAEVPTFRFELSDAAATGKTLRKTPWIFRCTAATDVSHGRWLPHSVATILSLGIPLLQHLGFRHRRHSALSACQLSRSPSNFRGMTRNRSGARPWANYQAPCADCRTTQPHPCWRTTGSSAAARGGTRDSRMAPTSSP